MNISFYNYNTKEEMYTEFKKYLTHLKEQIPNYFTDELCDKELSMIISNAEYSNTDKFHLDIYDSNRFYIYSLGLRYKKLINNEMFKDDYFGIENKRMFNEIIRTINIENKSHK